MLIKTKCVCLETCLKDGLWSDHVHISNGKDKMVDDGFIHQKTGNNTIRG